jgi:hypothetical protein
MALIDELQEACYQDNCFEDVIKVINKYYISKRKVKYAIKETCNSTINRILSEKLGLDEK